MSSIAPTHNNSGVLLNSTNNTDAQVVADNVKNSASTPDTSSIEPVTDNTVKVSSRASHIQKLNEEFFPGGPKTVKISSAFIQRLGEYGLISSADVQKLDTDASANQNEPGPLEELSSFIDEFSDKIAQQDPQNSLLETLQQAKTIIDSFGLNTPVKSSDIQAIIGELEQFKQSTSQRSLTAEDRASLEHLDLALKVAEKMNPASTSSQLGSYISTYNQSE